MLISDLGCPKLRGYACMLYIHRIIFHSELFYLLDELCRSPFSVSGLRSKPVIMSLIFFKLVHKKGWHLKPSTPSTKTDIPMFVAGASTSLLHPVCRSHYCECFGCVHFENQGSKQYLNISVMYLSNSWVPTYLVG